MVNPRQIERIVAAAKKLIIAETMRQAVFSTIQKNYNRGLIDFDNKFNLAINVAPNAHVIAFLTNYTFDNIKDLNGRMVEKLRKQLTEGMMQGESSDKIKLRVRDVMNNTLSDARRIAVTETHRAYNVGHDSAAKQSGLKLKKVAYNPSPVSAICKDLSNRRPIDIDAKFKHGGKEWLLPPFHPNCKTRVLYEQEATV